LTHNFQLLPLHAIGKIAILLLINFIAKC